jgi:hypothetical protein
MEKLNNNAGWISGQAKLVAKGLQLFLVPSLDISLLFKCHN